MKNNRAFTLIELLVVIAVIAILAAIVLVSLGGAQNRAKSSRVTSAMNQFRIQAQTIYSATSNYANVNCNGDATIIKICNDVASMNNLNPSIVIQYVPTTQYCASAVIPGGTGNNAYWCVDSHLNSIATSGACPAGTGTKCKP